ncbi:unnamed protein product [Cercospora beticola]|nr:unnamed protein product [Cercospora beticola]
MESNESTCWHQSADDHFQGADHCNCRSMLKSFQKDIPSTVNPWSLSRGIPTLRPVQALLWLKLLSGVMLSGQITLSDGIAETLLARSNSKTYKGIAKSPTSTIQITRFIAMKASLGRRQADQASCLL